MMPYCHIAYYYFYCSIMKTKQFYFQSSIDDLPVNGRALPLSTRPGTNRSDDVTRSSDVTLVSVGPSRSGSKSNVRSESQKSSTAASRRQSISRGSTSRSSKPISNISASKSEHQLAHKENGIQNTIDLVRIFCKNITYRVGKVFKKLVVNFIAF